LDSEPTPQVTCSVSVQEKNIKEKIDFVLHIADSVTLGGFLVISFWIFRAKMREFIEANHRRGQRDLCI
jgi:hypothetical protein